MPLNSADFQAQGFRVDCNFQSSKNRGSVQASWTTVQYIPRVVCSEDWTTLVEIHLAAIFKTVSQRCTGVAGPCATSVQNFDRVDTVHKQNNEKREYLNSFDHALS